MLDIYMSELFEEALRIVSKEGKKLSLEGKRKILRNLV